MLLIQKGIKLSARKIERTWRTRIMGWFYYCEMQHHSAKANTQNLDY